MFYQQKSSSDLCNTFTVSLHWGGEKAQELLWDLSRLACRGQRSRVWNSRGSLEQREMVCVNSVFTCSDRWTNYSECLRRSTDNQVLSLSAAYSHSGGQTHISLLSRLISVSLSVSASSSLHFSNSLTRTYTQHVYVLKWPGYGFLQWTDFLNVNRKTCFLQSCSGVEKLS